MKIPSCVKQPNWDMWCCETGLPSDEPLSMRSLARLACNIAPEQAPEVEEDPLVLIALARVAKLESMAEYAIREGTLRGVPNKQGGFYARPSDFIAWFREYIKKHPSYSVPEEWAAIAAQNLTPERIEDARDALIDALRILDDACFHIVSSWEYYRSEVGRGDDPMAAVREFDSVMDVVFQQLEFAWRYASESVTEVLVAVEVATSRHVGITPVKYLKKSFSTHHVGAFCAYETFCEGVLSARYSDCHLLPRGVKPLLRKMRYYTDDDFTLAETRYAGYYEGLARMAKEFPHSEFESTPALIRQESAATIADIQGSAPETPRTIEETTKRHRPFTPVEQGIIDALQDGEKRTSENLAEILSQSGVITGDVSAVKRAIGRLKDMGKVETFQGKHGGARLLEGGHH